MITTATLIGASSAGSRRDATRFKTVRKHVLRLQMRIAKATREGRWGKVKALQWLLTHTFSAKLLALEPVAETQADAMRMAQKQSAQWVFEGDIKACFDQISHPWLIANIPMDKPILEKWLAAGFMEDGIVYPTMAGTTQGGIASPVLTNMALDGLEVIAQSAAPRGQKIDRRQCRHQDG